MSFDTYISLVVTSLVAIAVALISILAPMIFSDSKNERQARNKGKNGNKQNKIIKFNKRKLILKKFNQKLTKQHKIAFCFMFLAGLVIIVATILYIVRRPHIYNDVINKARFEYDNHNFKEAAKYYDEAAYIAYNSETKVTALYSEGVCYFLLGIDSNDKKYFSQALEKYYTILNNKKYKNTKYYQDALIDTSFILREIYGELNDVNLKKIISELENTYDFTNLEYISENDIDLMNKVALAIAIYYKYLAHESFEIQDKTKTKEYSDKAIYYYSVVFQLTPQADRMHFKNTDLLYYYMEISDLMVKGSLSSENYNDAWVNFYNTINFCLSAINEYEISGDNPDMLAVYLRLKINLGKSYYFFSGLEGEEYISMAYDELRPLLYLSINKDIEDVLLDAGYYIILTKECNEEEIEIVLDRYEGQLEKMTIEDENYLRILQSALEACNFIVDIYGQNKHALELREELSDELNNVLSIYKK